MASRGDLARVALIEAAEELFAERGIESVSLRDISSAAGQRNHSAAQYHFGDRAGLVAAVFEHRMSEVNRRRHDVLDRLAATGGADRIDALVDAAVRPLAEVVHETDGWYARFLVRTRWDTFAREVVADLPVLSSFRRVVDLLVDHLVGDPEHRLRRVDQMSTLFIGTIAGWEWQRHLGRPRPTVADLCADLVATCHAVLTARLDVPDTAGSPR